MSPENFFGAGRVKVTLTLASRPKEFLPSAVGSGSTRAHIWQAIGVSAPETFASVGYIWVTWESGHYAA